MRYIEKKLRFMELEQTRQRILQSFTIEEALHLITGASIANRLRHIDEQIEKLN